MAGGPDNKNVAIFATGSREGGGSGARKLLEDANIAKKVCVLVTNYTGGGVARLAGEHDGIELEVMDKFPKRGVDGKFAEADQEIIRQLYLDLVKQYGLEYIFLSGWMKQILGLEANKVVNIHPGPLKEYGGEKMFGDAVHTKVWRSFFDGEIVSSAVTMHFVQSGPEDKMDNGAGLIVQVPVSLVGCKSQDDVKKRVNAMEHKIQGQITEHVINGNIAWSGIAGEPVTFTPGTSIDIDGTAFLLDGKEANLTEGLDGYGNVVVRLGDDASGNFKDACDEAMVKTSAYKEGLIKQTETKAWETIVQPSKNPVRVKEDIDGVGTKVHIYLEMFEDLCLRYRDGEIDQASCIAEAVDIWTPMLHDLFAMNADDLRDGQMAVSVTNIIDINHLGGERGRIFSASMSQAMKETTRAIDIGNVAGETAVIGLSSTSHKLLDLIDSDLMRNLDTNIKSGKTILGNIDALIADIGDDSINGIGAGAKSELESRIRAQIRVLVDDNLSQSIKEKTEILKKLEQILAFIDFNIGGTVQGVMQMEKLVPLEEGHVLVALYEKPDKNGIIGPRSNGITTIRKKMKELAGKKWTSMKFEAFLEHLGAKADLLPNDLKSECAGLTLGQIATGKTTVFNPFVSRDLLGGFKGKPEVKISSITNVTGNPGKKIKGGLRGAENMAIDINIKDAKIPHIIRIIQALTGMTDEEAMSNWNMGVPYVLACPASEVRLIEEKAAARGLKAEKIGTVVKKESDGPSAIVRGVGIGNSTVEVK